ncbi:hypothetical protein OFO07_02430 [Campylobacter sp. JMF_06 NA1]|uniref:hypothetical protein n=1 Tax=Campylobacter sp. JMF_06 NA1 TaxID=2983823 RepID=UPI0022E9CDF7|nr:hypothetical protein [Campylobacter sp. JMF_06 NA1]MDA3077782.1 hypothetical protein [Campylobacter sp. JMF_06 NA1]
MSFNITSGFSFEKFIMTPSQEFIINYFKNQFLLEIENPINLLSSPYFRDFMRKAFDNNLQYFMVYCREIPLEFIKEIFSELKGKNGVEFDKKFDSLRAELYAMDYFIKAGFELIKRDKRENGDCDIFVQKDKKKYNIEVKAKESDDVKLRRLSDIYNGYSCFRQYSFLRGELLNLKFLYENPYKCWDNIKDEVRLSLNELKKSGKFEGIFIKAIFDKVERKEKYRDDKVWDECVSDCCMAEWNENNKEFIKNKIRDLFIGGDKGNEKHITKLIKKSKNFENYIGFLYWVLPYKIYPDFGVIKEAFCEIIAELNIDFDLYVCLNHDRFEKNFIFKASSNNVV